MRAIENILGRRVDDVSLPAGSTLSPSISTLKQFAAALVALAVELIRLLRR